MDERIFTNGCVGKVNGENGEIDWLPLMPNSEPKAARKRLLIDSRIASRFVPDKVSLDSKLPKESDE
jgi:hypothetical protein